RLARAADRQPVPFGSTDSAVERRCKPGRGPGASRRAGGARSGDRARRRAPERADRGRLPAGDERRMTVRLTFEPFDPGALLSEFCRGRVEVGAVATFTGIARAEAGATVALELEAYPGFTEAEIGKLAGQAKVRFGLEDFAILHRVGRIAPGEPVVFVATAARHRRAAFEACDFLMDYLKSRAPFWKKEHGPDGARWVEPRAQDHADLKRWEKETSR